MRDRPKVWNVGMLGIYVVAAMSGVLLAQSQSSDQPKQRSGGGQEAGREVNPGGQDAQMLVAHGLAMAIEGSTLQGIAMQSGGQGGAAGSTRGSGAGASGTSGLGGNPGTGGANTVIPGAGLSTPGGTVAVTPGAGLATPGGTVADVSATGTLAVGGRGAGATPGAGGAGAGATPGAGGAVTGAAGTAAPGAGVGGRPMMMPGQSAEQLREHARRAFEASDKLLRQAAGTGGSTDRFYRASNRYATTLRSLGGQASARGGSGGDAATSGMGAVAMSGADLTSVTLINHGVKEALDSYQIKQMVRHMGDQGEAARTLMDHARQMDSESQQAIQALAGAGADGGTGRPGVGAGATGGVGGAGTTGTSGLGGGLGGGTGTTGSPAEADTRRAQELSTATYGRAPSGPGSGIGASGAGAGGVAGAGAIGGGGQGGVVSSLVQQAQEVLQAIRELDGSSGERSGSGRGTPGSGAAGSTSPGSSGSRDQGRSPQ